MAHNTIDQLNHLVRINRDAEAAFDTAATDVRNTELETLFTGYAKQHAKFSSELQEQIEHLGGSTSNSGTLGGAIDRGWMNLKATVSGHSAAAMLKSCASGEESAESAYLDALDSHPTGQTHSLIQKHLEQIKGFRTRLARLVGETEDGKDFQKND